LTSVQRFLLDTNILSETRKKESHPAVRAFVSGVVQSALYMSVLTLGELRRSVVKKARTNAAIAASYSAWIDDLEAAFADQVLDIDRTISTSSLATPPISAVSPSNCSIRGKLDSTRFRIFSAPFASNLVVD
jgi:hypothetical protein